MSLLKHIVIAVITGAALEVGHELVRRGLERRRIRKIRETAMGAKLKNIEARVKTIELLLSEHEDEDELEADEEDGDAESPGRPEPAEVSDS